MKQRTVRLGGQRWSVRWVSYLGADLRGRKTPNPTLGNCDKATRIIQVVARMEPHEERRVLLHEMLHAECDWLDEQHVDEISARINDALAKCGHPAKREET